MDKYEEALERAREWEREHPNGCVIRDMMEYIFPGYNDSEDERIRQTLIDMVKRETGFTGFPSQGQVLAYLEKQKEQKPVARENDFVSNPKTSVEVLRHYLVWAGSSEEEDCPYTWKTLADAIRDGINALEEQKPAEWSEGDGLARDFLLKQTEQYIKVLESIKTEKYIGAKGLIDVASELSDWQSARSFILSLQPHWKPSEEQMDALAWYNDDKAIKSLYNDLKKLL